MPVLNSRCGGEEKGLLQMETHPTGDEILAEIEQMVDEYRHAFKVYKITGPTGLVYIGSCMGEPEKRWKSGNGYRGKRFRKALDEYGWDAFSTEILETDLSPQRAKELEQEYILKYESTNPQKGYNVLLPKLEQTNRHYTVYLLVAPNFKRYVGFTGRTLEERWDNGNGYKENAELDADIHKFGPENFILHIIGENLDYETAKNLEYFTVRFQDLMNPDKGYNKNLGGFSEKGTCVSDETRRKMSESAKAKYRNDEAYRQRITLINRANANNPERIRKLSESKSRAVVCTSTDRTFKSIKEAAELTGISKSSICLACRGRQKTAGGLSWAYL